ncbi:MAG: hypothetical protein Q7R71_02380 [bacterium]|nr:hypothetical protein [bacterium]
MVLYRIPAVGEQQRTQEVVAKIHAQKITLADVIGNVLPPTPNKEENDATVEGIDKNNNGIRDDVELAIFAKYPNSAKIRAAELQYAMTEQMFLTEVFNAETWKAVAQQDSRGYACIGETIPRTNITENLKTLDLLIKEVQDLVFNIQMRKNAKERAYSFTTSYADLRISACDIDLNTFSN